MNGFYFSTYVAFAFLSLFSASTDAGKGSSVVGAPPVNCGETFFDSGGPSGMYTDNEYFATTFCPDLPDQYLVVQFLSFQTESCCDFLSIRDGDSEGAPFLGSYSGDNSPGAVYGSGPGGCLTFVFTSDGSVIAPGWEAEVSCITCPPPPALTAGSPSPSSILLQWNTVQGAERYHWEVGLPGFEPGTGAAVASGDTTASLVTAVGLESGIAYEAYVRTDCGGGDVSPFSGPALFSTAVSCNGSFFDSGGPDAPYQDNETIETIICPDVPGQFVQVSFTQFETESCCDYLSIYDGNSFDAPLLVNLFGVQQPGVISAANPSGCLAFRFISDVSVVGAGWAATVSCTSCPGPNNLVIDDIAVYEARLSCSELGPSVEYSWEVGTPGFVPGEPGAAVSVVATSASTVEFAGLQSNTSYEAYVRVVCSSGDTSRFIGPASFTTHLTCGDTFYDPGGPDGPHGPDAGATTIICPTNPGEFVTVQFEEFDVSSCCANLVVKGGESPFSTTIGFYSGSDIPGPFASMEPSGCMSFEFQSFSDSDEAGWMAGVSCTTCPFPNRLEAFNINASSMDLSWQPAPGSAGYLWEVGLQGFTPGTGNAIASGNTDNTFAAVNGLPSNTALDIYLWSTCSNGDTSAFTGPLGITTQPSCGDPFYDAGGPSGNYPSGSPTSVTLCPDEPGTFLSVTFNSFETDTNDVLAVYSGYFGTLLGEFSGSATPGTLVSSDFNGCLTFQFFSFDDVTGPGWEAELECVTCSATPFFRASFFGPEEVTLTWGDLPNGPAYEWEAGLPGFVPGTGSAVSSGTETGPAATVGGLSSGAEYEFYVRADCGMGDTGPFAGPFRFRTTPSCTGTFYDSGGPDGNYGQPENTTFLLCPENEGEYVAVSFNEFSTESCCDYLRVYDGDSSSDPELGAFSGSLLPGPFVSTHPSGCLTFVFNADFSSTRSGWAAEVSCVTCTAPGSLSISGITENSADLGWATVPSAASYNWEIGPAGFTPGTGSEAAAGNTALNSAAASGLESGTLYEAYIRSDCGEGGFSFFNGPFGFRTRFACGDLFYDPGGPSGNYSDREDALITICPPAAGQSVEVTFLSFITESCCDYLEVFDGNSTTGASLGTFSGSSIPGPFTSAHPSGCLTFRFRSDGSVTYEGWTAEINCIGCLLPQGLVVSDIEPARATLSWTGDDLAASYNWEIGLPGFTPGIGLSVQNGNTPNSQVTIEGLAQGTEYEAYVRAICSATDIGGFAGPLAFSTTVSGLGGPFNSREGLFAVFPNPTSGAVLVRLECPQREDVEASVRNLTGQVLYTRKWNLAEGQHEIPLSLASFPPGTYLLTVSGASGTAVERIIRQ